MDWDDEAIKRLYADIGTRIRSARNERGWSQLDLASAVGLTRSSIANIEAGRQRALVHAVVLIAQVLDVSISRVVPVGEELDKLAKIRPPVLDLAGQPDSTQDFVTSAIRRATGG